MIKDFAMKDLSYLNVPLTFKGSGLQAREFDGYGSVFGNEDLGGDIVLPGAFARSLAEYRASKTLPQMFWMHKMDQVPGKWLSMAEDEEGLAVKGVLAETQLGNEMYTLLKMDAVRGLSIGYRAIDYDWDKDGRRLLKEVKLWEVSLVSLGMNPLAEVTGVKSRLSVMGEYVPSAREMEKAFREMGCSKAVSHTLVAKLFEGRRRDADVNRRDAGPEKSAAAGLLKSLRALEGQIVADSMRVGSIFK